MINLSCIANILRKHHFTSVIITIWIQKNGESEILLSPDEPYANIGNCLESQQEAMQTL